MPNKRVASRRHIHSPGGAFGEISFRRAVIFVTFGLITEKVIHHVFRADAFCTSC